MASAKKSPIGKGLTELLGSNQRNPAESKVQHFNGVSEIEISHISANPEQPRKTFNDQALQELSESIKELGIIQPITVRKTGINAYQIISGERRFRASKIAGLEKIPAYVRSENDQNTLLLGLVENLQREDLDPIEVAITFQRLLDECNLTQEQLGQKVGKNHATIANSLRLLKLPPEIQNGLANGDISEGHAKAILSISDESKQKELYTEIITKNLSVRNAEELARKYKEGQNKHTRPTKTERQKKLQTTLEDKLKTKVSINVTSKGTGKISIAFKNENELNTIVQLIEQIQ